MASITIAADPRAVFNTPWHLYPFTLDLRPPLEQGVATFLSAFPLPFLHPHTRANVKRGLADAYARAVAGWLPLDSFQSATLVVPLSARQAQELAYILLAPPDEGGEGEGEGEGEEEANAGAAGASRASRSAYSAASSSRHTSPHSTRSRRSQLSSSSAASGPTPPTQQQQQPPAALSAEAEYVSLIVELLASGEGLQLPDPADGAQSSPSSSSSSPRLPTRMVTSFRFLAADAAAEFLRLYPFMAHGSRVVATAGAGATQFSGGIAPLAIARAIPPLPFCVLDEGLFVGSYEQASSSIIFSRLRIGAVVNVTMEKECPNFFESRDARTADMRKDIVYLRLPIADMNKENLRACWEKAIPFIDACLNPHSSSSSSSSTSPAHSAAAAGGGGGGNSTIAPGAPVRRRRVLVHCARGLSRSVAIVYAYLLLRRGARTLEEARGWLDGYEQYGWKPRPILGFMRQLGELEQEVRKERERREEETARRLAEEEARREALLAEEEFVKELKKREAQKDSIQNLFKDRASAHSHPQSHSRSTHGEEEGQHSSSRGPEREEQEEEEEGAGPRRTAGAHKTSPAAKAGDGHTNHHLAAQH